MELKVQSDRVIEAAHKCPQAEETLKTLFPEAFKPSSNTCTRPNGQFYVRRRSDHVRSIATTFPDLLEVVVKFYRPSYNPVVVVWMPSFETRNSPNCYIYTDWDSFFKLWEIVN